LHPGAHVLTAEPRAGFRSVGNISLRDEAGITNIQVYRHADNPKEVIVGANAEFW
jgi:hypothetical protein